MPMKENWYAYECAPSSETRGRRKAHDKGCGWWNVYGSNKPLDGRHDIQASPCEMCANRKRLNAGNVDEMTFGKKQEPLSPAKKREIAHKVANVNNFGTTKPSEELQNRTKAEKKASITQAKREEMASKSSVNPEEEVSA